VAAENRWANDPLGRALSKSAREAEFFKAVHLVQSAYPDAAPIGQQGPPERESVRFVCDLSLGFPASDMTQIEVRDTGGELPRFEMTTAFMGIYGSSSPLPVFYTEDVMDQDPDESLVKGFIDLFHHRIISLVYRVWEKYRYDLLFRAGGTDVLSRRLLHMIGLGSDVAPPRPKIAPVRMLAYAGLITQLPHSASALRGMLAEFFEPIGVAIDQFIGQYVSIDPSQRTRLGVANFTLGSDAVLGERVFDIAATFRVCLGPVGLADFLTFLPPGGNTARLKEIVELVNNDSLDYELEVTILRDEIPELRLADDKARLGWSTWLGQRPETNQSVRFLVKGRTHGQR
jgi:type VI secretion system protein ImpH